VRLAPDPQKAGRVYLTWLQGADVAPLRFTAPGNPIMAVRSDDGGETWSKPVALSGPKRGRVITPAPVVGRDGTLYVLYLDIGEDRLNYEAEHRGRGGEPYEGRYTLVLARSRDRGARWKESVVDNRLSPIERFIVFLAPAPTVAVDSTGRLYAAFQDDRLGDADVWLWSLAPGASDWGEPTRVNDTRPRDGTAQYLPKLSVAPNDRLDVLYYDRREDRQNLMNQVSLQSSFDHGKSFTPALNLTSRAFDSRIGFGAKEGLPDLGSRLALISGDRAALGLWTDTRAGTPATQKQDLAEAAIAVSDPARLSDAARSALRFGGVLAGLAGLLLLALALRGRGAARTRPDAVDHPGAT
ncbi:MAG: glycoside hydrolase, partial [Actinomycetota bacterium]|nr:glycoside hydrolase [Actinomycetota bacterium]